MIKLELRDLDPANEEDKWFVQQIDILPRLIYDYSIINEYISKATLRSIEDIPLSTSHANQKLKKAISGDINNVLMDIKFKNRDGNIKEMEEAKSNMARGIMRCFDEDCR